VAHLRILILKEMNNVFGYSHVEASLNLVRAACLEDGSYDSKGASLASFLKLTPIICCVLLFSLSQSCQAFCQGSQFIIVLRGPIEGYQE